LLWHDPKINTEIKMYKLTAPPFTYGNKFTKRIFMFRKMKCHFKYVIWPTDTGTSVKPGISGDYTSVYMSTTVSLADPKKPKTKKIK